MGIDDGDESLYALEWAVSNLFNGQSSAAASAADDGEPTSTLLTFLHVHQPTNNYGVAPSTFPAGQQGFVAANYPSTMLVDSVRKSQEEIAAAILHMQQQGLMKAVTVIVGGNPKDTICEICEQMKMDLLVVGSPGLGKNQRAFLGSVSDYCAHHAKCPILIVKLPKQATKD